MESYTEKLCRHSWSLAKYQTLNCNNRQYFFSARMQFDISESSDYYLLGRYFLRKLLTLWIYVHPF